jgi:hypothetical protein
MLLASIPHPRLGFLFGQAIAATCVAGCAAALGPGYVIDKQEIRVQFTPDPRPAIHIEAEYHLRNTGNRALALLELRLPGRRRFHFVDPRVDWDAHTLALAPSPYSPRNVAVTFAEPWTISSSHTLRLGVDYQPAAPGENVFTFASDGFFLPAGGWSPQLLPAHGIFATGGIPPEKWLLTLRAPDDFLVHMSGHQLKRSHSGHEQNIRAEQRPHNGYPFVIAGRYAATQLKAAQETVNLWTRAPQVSDNLRPAADALLQTVRTYDAMFGNRRDQSHQLWIVECPVVNGCFTSTASNYAQLILDDRAKASAEMASLDSVMADLTSGSSQIAVAAAPSLASSWLGYGQNPGFYEQNPPLSALPAFAAARGREAVQGPRVRVETIRRVLRQVPVDTEPHTPETDAVVRAKSLLFFYGLQDRYGQDTCNKALSHMLYARRGGGFDLADLIAAFEQEAHQNVAEFVRQWMKRPGVPDDFRARYETPSAAKALDTSAVTTKETRQ